MQYFMMAERDRIKLAHPDASFGELGKLAGAEWKALTDSAKQPYIQQSEVRLTRCNTHA